MLAEPPYGSQRNILRFSHAQFLFEHKDSHPLLVKMGHLDSNRNCRILSNVGLVRDLPTSPTKPERCDM